jgi:hypothetical protein
MTFGKLLRGFASLAFAAGLTLAPAAQAVTVLPLYLDEMADGAAVAFEGRCIGNRSEVDAGTGLIVTYTTFDVRDVLKGSPGSTYEIKQVGGALPNDGPQYRVLGVPKFELGEDYVVFLAGVSTAGFSSPIGLAQGRFKVDREGNLRKVGNGRDFKDMTRRILSKVPAATRALMDKDDKALREMDVDEFKQLVRNHLGAKR